VRQKVLIAQLKMLQNLDAQIIEDALRTVPYASFLAAILSQKDHLSLVALALQCAQLLFERLENIYQYQFHREGVITEIAKLAETPVSSTVTEGEGMNLDMGTGNGDSSDSGDGDSSENDEEKDNETCERRDDDDESPDDEDDNEDDHGDDDDVSESDSSSSISGRPLSQTLGSAIQDVVTRSAKEFLQIYEGSKGRGMHDKALRILHDLQQLAAEIKDCYISGRGGSGIAHFQKLASYFDGDALESITSSELLNSGIIRVLLDVIGHTQGKLLPNTML
jgi:E3 ubiquitin-protein ligase TRIP12